MITTNAVLQADGKLEPNDKGSTKLITDLGQAIQWQHRETAMTRTKLATIRTAMSILCLLLMSVTGTSMQAQATEPPAVAPIKSHPYDASYSTWAARWWKWALTISRANNPTVTDGAVDCSLGQRDDDVWFLGGRDGGGTAVRSCSIPAETALFFPVYNSFDGATEGDSDFKKKINPDRIANVNHNVDAVTVAAAEVDGIAVPNVLSYREQSKIFRVILSANNNLFDIPVSITVDPAVDAGIYLMLRPLSPGYHTIHFTASSGSTLLQDITYNLTVKSERKH